MIAWFKEIPNKERCSFVKYDIADFYPSISEKLLENSIDFARNLTDIDDDSIRIIMHCRKSLLFCYDSAWIKKSGSLFDVTMGSYDGAEVCELVGLFLLHQVSQLFGTNNNGLYRDDGLAILNNTPGSATERTKKKLIKLFKDNGLKIVVESRLTQTDFLDVTFNLKSRKFWLYRKPNDQPLYIDMQSNHPPKLKENLPSMLAQRISQNSSDREQFDKALPSSNIQGSPEKKRVYPEDGIHQQP